MHGKEEETFYLNNERQPIYMYVLWFHPSFENEGPTLLTDSHL